MIRVLDLFARPHSHDSVETNGVILMIKNKKINNIKYSMFVSKRIETSVRKTIKKTLLQQKTLKRECYRDMASLKF